MTRRVWKVRRRNADFAISTIVLRCADLDRSVAFYRRLGLQFEAEQHGAGPLHYSAVSGRVLLELYPAAEGRAPDSTTQLGLVVDDVDHVVSTLEDEDHGPKRWTSGEETASLRDPDGRIVRIRAAPRARRLSLRAEPPTFA